MHPITQLDEIRRLMAEELAQVSQYRALKAIERFIGELSVIYDKPTESPAHEEVATAHSKIAQAIENHVRGDSGPAIVKNASYLPVHRVA